MSQQNVWVEGTTCRSCEIAIEHCWQDLPGVKSVKVNSATGQARLNLNGKDLPLEQLQAALKDTHYKVAANRGDSPDKRLSVKQLVIVFGLVLLMGYILSSIGILKNQITISQSLGFGGAFLVGLVAASSSCVAVVGGVLLSTVSKFTARYQNATPFTKARPVLLFVLGRVFGYGLLGGMLGVVGSVLAPSPTITAMLTLVAAGYMIIMGLDMLHLAPRFLLRLVPRLPKVLGKRVLAEQNKEHGAAPFLLGAATFFLPCGFTQALQIYALTTHNFWLSAQILFAFALGTAPALTALGLAAGSLKEKFGRWFFNFSGAVVIVLGLWSIQNALAIVGYPVFEAGQTQNAPTEAEYSSAANVNSEQVVKMTADYTGYHPNRFTVKAGVPVRWEINGAKAGGCAAVLVSRQLNLQKFLAVGLNTVRFVPKAAGEIAFSCSMGMYRGSFNVVD